jgi:Tannase and feruloyl esterase
MEGAPGYAGGMILPEAIRSVFVISANGGPGTVAQWSRLFLGPGMAHCAGGPSLDHFDMLGPVVDWVEKGAAPDFILATGKTFPRRSRPLCAYPTHAQYTDIGNPQDAHSFRCQ